MMWYSTVIWKENAQNVHQNHANISALQIMELYKKSLHRIAHTLSSATSYIEM